VCVCRPKNIGRLCKALAVNATLTELDLSGCNIEDGGAREMADALEANVVLRSLNLARNRITDSGAAQLSNALLCFNTTLEYLDMNGNLVGGVPPSPRCEAWNVSTAPSRLAACPYLTYLDMSSCGISDGDTLCIAEVLSCSSRWVPRAAILLHLLLLLFNSSTKKRPALYWRRSRPPARVIIHLEKAVSWQSAPTSSLL
jgi:Leucine-rich repeat (LRR) protein